MFSYGLFVFWFLFVTIENFNLGLTGDAEHGGWWLEANRPVEPGLELLYGPIHQDHGGAVVDADYPAKAAVEFDDVAGG